MRSAGSGSTQYQPHGRRTAGGARDTVATGGGRRGGYGYDRNAAHVPMPSDTATSWRAKSAPVPPLPPADEAPLNDSTTKEYNVATMPTANDGDLQNAGSQSFFAAARNDGTDGNAAAQLRGKRRNFGRGRGNDNHYNTQPDAMAPDWRPHQRATGHPISEDNDEFRQPGYRRYSKMSLPSPTSLQWKQNRPPSYGIPMEGHEVGAAEYAHPDGRYSAMRRTSWVPRGSGEYSTRRGGHYGNHIYKNTHFGAPATAEAPPPPPRQAVQGRASLIVNVTRFDATAASAVLKQRLEELLTESLSDGTGEKQMYIYKRPKPERDAEDDADSSKNTKYSRPKQTAAKKGGGGGRHEEDGDAESAKLQTPASTPKATGSPVLTRENSKEIRQEQPAASRGRRRDVNRERGRET